MDDLISRAAAIEAALNGADDWDGGYNPERERCIREHMAKVPAVDAVPVVRCKGCKHRNPEDKWCDCGGMEGLILPRQDNWFCADGERRESDG